MKKAIQVVCVVAVASIAGLVETSQAANSILLGIDVEGQNGGSSRLLEIDPETGTSVEIGPLTWQGQNIGTAEGLAWDKTAGQLYVGSSWLNTPYPGWLWTVDIESGALTPIGQATLPPNPHGGSGGGYEALDFSPDGILYASTGQLLYIVNPADGSAGLVGSFGGYFVEGMSFDDTGNLWGTADPTGLAGADTLVRIDLGTAAVSEVGRIVATNESLDGFDILDDGTFIAVSGVAKTLMSIAPTTGAPSGIGTLDVGVVTALQDVPEPATMTLLSLGGLVLLRRRKRNGRRFQSEGCEL
jgi:hypothetical protein